MMSNQSTLQTVDPAAGYGEYVEPNAWPGTTPATPPVAARKRSPVLLIVGAVFTAVGLVLGAVCILIVALDNNFRETAVRTTGTIVSYETRQSTSRDDDRGTRRSETYAPVVKFTTKDGRTIEFTSSVSSSSKPVPGRQVDVLYHPDDPQHAKVDDAAGRLLAPLITGGLGGIFLPLGLLFLGLHWRGRRRAA
jgi:hypothetical protein